MNNFLERFNTLLLKYRFGQMNSEDFSELKKNIDGVSDDNLRTLIENQWNTFEGTKKLSEEKKNQIMQNVQERISIPKRFSMKMVWTSVAAVIVLLVLSNVTVFLLTEHFHENEMAEQKIEINARDSNQSEIKLSDGTIVNLNKNSILSYAHDFNDTKRVVELQGEGYFKVKKNPEKEFIVKTKYINVTVLGTTFNVHSYEDEDIVETTLFEGKVQLTTNNPPYQEVVLHPKEKVMYSKKTGKLKLVKTNQVPETIWETNTLVFKDTPIKEVFKTLEYKFGVSFTFKNRNSLNDLYTGKFDDNNLESILQVLQWHYHFDYLIDKNHIIIK